MTDYPLIFVALINTEIGLEGGYTNDAANSGGPTIWGITEADARSNGYTGDMRAMPRDTAVAIYFQKYWIGPQFDQLAVIDMPIAGKLLDIGINMGPEVGVKFLQRCLNVLANGAYSSLDVDGGCGNDTRTALRHFIDIRGADGRKVLLGMIIALQSVFYITDAENNSSQQVFEYGWEINRAVGTTFTGA